MKMNNHALLLALPACLILFATNLHADDLICDSGSVCDLPPLVDGDVIVTNGSLARVPRDATSIVTGDVIVSDGGRLSFHDILVEGDIIAEGVGVVVIVNSAVGGDVEIQGQEDSRFSMTIRSTLIGGDLLITENDVNNFGVSSCAVGGDVLIADNSAMLSMTISRNEIDGSLLLFDNLAADRVLVLRNTISGDLLCSGNDPDPTLDRNDVSGDIDCED